MTPLQLARAIGGLSQRGVWQTPHLLKAETGKLPVHTLKLDPENIEAVISGMSAVVNEGGTGVRARLPGIEVCGKTGTAQRGGRRRTCRDGAIRRTSRPLSLRRAAGLSGRQGRRSAHARVLETLRA